MCLFYFFFNDTATTEIYTLSLHDALPISAARVGAGRRLARQGEAVAGGLVAGLLLGPLHGGVDGPQLADRKSTRLNSSHANISYAVFCLKKKNNRLTV